MPGCISFRLPDRHPLRHEYGCGYGRSSVKHWERRTALSTVLWPLSLLYRSIVWLRKKAFDFGLLPKCTAPVPVVVVGNIMAGGAGKTPLTIALVNLLVENGNVPAVVSRGYGGAKLENPQLVKPDSDAAVVGDEPVLIVQKTGVPLVVYPKRCAAIDYLMNVADPDVILCDDGLQHYALERDIEIAVVHGSRLHGNGWCLPAGPLREPVSRLGTVDFVVTNGRLPENSRLENSRGVSESCYFESGIEQVRRLSDGKSIALSSFSDSVGSQGVHALSGIAYPAGFHQLLENAGLRIHKISLSDHHRFTEEDFKFEDELPIVMTEKDAVKCHALDIDLERCWQTILQTELSAQLKTDFLERINRG